jgi:hypothetical protein
VYDDADSVVEECLDCLKALGASPNVGRSAVGHCDECDEKYKYAIGLLNHAGDKIIHVHMDPRGADVKVPPELRLDPILRLDIRFDPKKPDGKVRMDAAGIEGRIGKEFETHTARMPWHSVFAIFPTSMIGQTWVDSVPKDVPNRAYYCGESDT